MTLEKVKARAVHGVVTLTGRSFLLHLLSFIATGFLWAFLDQSQFGVFAMVSAVVNFLAYFSDIGLAASLIQKRKKVTDEDLKTTFTVQQGLVILLLLILFLSSPFIAKFYKLSQEGLYLLYALGISLLLSSLKTIPSTLLERKLKFERLVFPQILENIVYNIVVVLAAWKGLGITSFTIAVLIRGLVGLVAIYLLQPWMPGLAFSRKSLRKLLRFGLPYQLNTLLATIKDDGLIIVLGGILGSAGMGFLSFAQKLGQMPLRFFMDNVLKVSFPAFSRMQDDKKQLERFVTRSIFFVCFLVFPSILGILIVAPFLVRVIPRYQKWIPALTALSFFAISASFAAATTQLTNLLNAIGKIKITFKLMIMWTVLSWILLPFLTKRYGVNGAAAGYALVSSSSVIAIYIARRYVKFSLLESIFKPGIAGLTMAALLLLVRNFLPVNLISIVILVILGGIFYFIVIYSLMGASIFADVKKGFRTVFSK